MAALPNPAHLNTLQSFSLRPSAAADNLFARVREARANHEPVKAPDASVTTEEPICRSQNSHTPDPKPVSPQEHAAPGSSSAPAPLMLSAVTHDPRAFELALEPPGRCPSPPPASSPVLVNTLAKMDAAAGSISTSPPPTQTTASTRKHRPKRNRTRSVSPRSSDGVPPIARPNSFGSATSLRNAITHGGLPEQLELSPRREQSALASQMLVSQSGGALAGGSVRALLERMRLRLAQWAVKTHDIAAQADLLFSFRISAPPDELFSAWCSMAADSLYRSRLLEFLRLWLSGYFVLDFRKKPLFSRLLRTVETYLQPDEVTNLKLLCLNVNFRFGNTGVATLRKQAVERMLVASGGLLSTPVLSIDAVADAVLAEQLTLINSYLFRNLSPCELVEWVIRGVRTDESAPHITEILGYSARLSAWATAEALKGTPLARLIGLGQRLQVFGNFEALRALLTGMQHPAVTRLTAAWEALPAVALEAFDALEELMSATGDFKLYRQTLALRSTSPLVPVLSIHLHDLTVAYQRGANATLLPNRMLSAAFTARMGGILREFMLFQRTEAYPHTMQSAMVNYLLNVKTLNPEELAALSPKGDLQNSGNKPAAVATPDSAAKSTEQRKGLHRGLSARSLNGFLADLIRRADEPALPPQKDKERTGP